MRHLLKQIPNLYMLIPLAIGTRLIAIILKFPGFPPGWGGETAAIANSIATGNGFASPYVAQTGPTALIPPVYAYLLSIFYTLFGPGSEMAGIAALGLNVVLSALVLIPLFVLTKRLFNQRAALAAVWVWAVLPLSGYTDALYIWNTSLFTLALTTFLAFTLSLEKEDLLAPRVMVYGLFAGFIVLIEPVALIVVAVSFFWLAYQKFPANNLVQFLVIASLLPSAWIARNFIVFREPVFIRSGFGLELSVGIRDNEFTSEKPSSLPNRNPAELRKFTQMGELSYVQSRYEEAAQWIKENPGEYGTSVVKRVIAYWTGHRVSQIYLFYGRFEEIKRIFYTLPALGAILSLFFLKKKDLMLILPFLLLYPVVYYVTHVELRYRLPLEPLLYGVAVGAVVSQYESKWMARMKSVTTSISEGILRSVPDLPLVSVIIPVFNGERFLRASLDSILAQSYPHLEVIVMDDASTDSTPAIVASFGDRVKYHRQERNRGIYGNANDGIALAQGEYIAIYHADDVYEPEIVEREVAALTRFPNAGAAFCLDTFVDAEGKPYGKLTIPPEVAGGQPLPYPVILNALLTHKNKFLVCPTSMVRAEVYRDAGVYRDAEFRNTSDLEMWLRIARKYPLVIVEEHLLRYRHGHENSSRRYHHLRTTAENYFRIMDLYLEEGDRAFATLQALAAYEAHRAQDNLMIAVNHYILGERKQARSALRRVAIKNLMGSAQIQRMRMLILWVVMRVLVYLPQIHILADLLYKRWHVKSYGENRNQLAGGI